MQACPEPRGAENKRAPHTTHTRKRKAIETQFVIVVAVHVIYERLKDEEEELAWKT